jgi:putative transposase
VPPTAPTLTLSELEACLRSFLIEDNHRRVHGETGARPQERWDAGGFLPRLPDSLEQLDLLLLTVATPRTVHPDGIRFQGMRYLDPTLAAYVGEAVTIRYDPRDLAEPWVYHRDTFVCRAICPELAGETIALKDLVRARTERRQAPRGTLTEREQIVRQFPAVHDAAPASPPAASAAAGAPPRPRLKRYLNE